VQRGPLQAVLAMGFDEKEAAIALYRTGEDPEAAVALLLGQANGESALGAQDSDEADMARALALSMEGVQAQKDSAMDVQDSDEEDLAQAVALSMKGVSQDGSKESEVAKPEQPRSGPYGGFRYGEDYPKPMIQPVSMSNTEEQEDEARKEQAKRDQQITMAKRRKGSGGKSFSRPQWEESRQQWKAETPTAAKNTSASSRRDVQQREDGTSPGGTDRRQDSSRDRKWQERRNDGYNATDRGQQNDRGTSDDAGRRRRWGGKS